MKPTRSYDIHIDGASLGNPGPSGVGVVLVDGPAPPARPSPAPPAPALAPGGPGGRSAVAKGGPGPTQPVRQFAKHVGWTTNNVAEYLALIYALQEALAQGARHVTVKTDSELLARQMSGQYAVRDPHLRLLHDLASHLVGKFSRCTIAHIPRSQNALADRLAGRAARSRV